MGNRPLHPIQKYISGAKNDAKKPSASFFRFEDFNTQQPFREGNSRKRKNPALGAGFSLIKLYSNSW
jgi:hypothetical protein